MSGQGCIAALRSIIQRSRARSSGKANMKLVSTLPLIFLVASSALGQRGAAAAGHVSAAAAAGRSFSMASSGYSHSSGSVPAYRPNLAAPSHALYGSPSYSSPIGPPPFGGTQPIPGKHYRYPTNGNRPYYRGAYVYPTYLGYGGFYGYAGYPDDSSYGDQPQQPAPAYQDVNAQAAPPDNGYYDQTYASSAAPAPRVPARGSRGCSGSGPAGDDTPLQGWPTSAAGTELCRDFHHALCDGWREATRDSVERDRPAADREGQSRCRARF